MCQILSYPHGVRWQESPAPPFEIFFFSFVSISLKSVVVVLSLPEMTS